MNQSPEANLVLQSYVRKILSNWSSREFNRTSKPGLRRAQFSWPKTIRETIRLTLFIVLTLVSTLVCAQEDLTLTPYSPSLSSVPQTEDQPPTISNRWIFLSAGFYMNKNVQKTQSLVLGHVRATFEPRITNWLACVGGLELAREWNTQSLIGLQLRENDQLIAPFIQILYTNLIRGEKGMSTFFDTSTAGYEVSVGVTDQFTETTDSQQLKVEIGYRHQLYDRAFLLRVGRSLF